MPISYCFPFPFIALHTSIFCLLWLCLPFLLFSPPFFCLPFSLFFFSLSPPPFEKLPYFFLNPPPTRGEYGTLYHTVIKLRVFPPIHKILIPGWRKGLLKVQEILGDCLAHPGGLEAHVFSQTTTKLLEKSMNEKSMNYFSMRRRLQHTGLMLNGVIYFLFPINWIRGKFRQNQRLLWNNYPQLIRYLTVGGRGKYIFFWKYY